MSSRGTDYKYDIQVIAEELAEVKYERDYYEVRH